MCGSINCTAICMYNLLPQMKGKILISLEPPVKNQIKKVH
jgi:hypothetical protein